MAFRLFRLTICRPHAATHCHYKEFGQVRRLRAFFTVSINKTMTGGLCLYQAGSGMALSFLAYSDGWLVNGTRYDHLFPLCLPCKSQLSPFTNQAER